MKGYHHQHPRMSPPFVTASKHGKCVINKTALALLRQHDATHVCLLVDVSGRSFALRPVPASTPHAFRLNYRRAAQAGFNIPHFWTQVGIVPRAGGERFLASWDNETGMLTMRLNDI